MATAAQEAARANRRVDSLEQKQKQWDYELHDPKAKGGLVRATKGMQRAHERITQLGQNLGGRLDLVEETLQAMQAGGTKGLIQALRDNNHTDQQIAEILIIFRTDDDDPLDLTDQQLLVELFGAFALVKGTVARHEDRLTGLETRISTAESSLEETRTELHDSDGVDVPRGVLPFAFIAAIIAAVLFNIKDWNDTADIMVGDQKGTADLHYGVLDAGWIAIVFGIGVFCFIVVIALIASNVSERTSSFVHERRSSRASATHAETGSGDNGGNDPGTAPTTVVTTVTTPTAAQATVNS